MIKQSIASARIVGALYTALAAMAQIPSPGHVNYVANAGASFDSYTYAPSLSQQQWFLDHFANMVVYTPYFDIRTAWYPNAYAYMDLYGIQKGSSEEVFHPEWILRDQNGNKLYIPYNCGGGTCAMWAADIANPAFRAAWITSALGNLSGGNYLGLYIDDVNLEFRVSDGWGNQAAPIDFNTSQPMTYDAWRTYVAAFVEQVRAALPNKGIIENSLWFAGPAGVQDKDPAVQRQIATADKINLERGIASDPNLTGGTGFWSVYSFFDFVDRLHSAGKGVNFQEYGLDAAGQEYGLASYFMISGGNDSIGDDTSTPDNWWTGYETDLGAPLGPRSYDRGVFQRDFSGGKVLLGEPGLSPRSVDLGGTFTTLDGTAVSSVTVTGRQGIVLLATASANAVCNAASLAAGPVSPGEIFTVFGSFPSATRALFVDGLPAPVIYADSKQVNAVMPFGLDLGNAAQVEIRQDQGSAKVEVPVVAASPAIFTLSTTGSGPGAILNQNYSVNSATNAAIRGSVIMIYGTGFGALSPLPADGLIEQTPALTTSPVTATVDGVPAEVLYAGAAPGLIAGAVQVNVRVPEAVAANPSAPISLRMGPFTTQAGVTVAVQ
ncbi:MAG: hypothetical protein LAP40_12165 [Acidobacteriia bacterium]|nr:hypothetical protein [Terriglobia bacterium]